MIHWRLLLPILTISLLLLLSAGLPQFLSSDDRSILNSLSQRQVPSSPLQYAFLAVITVLANRQFWIVIPILAAVIAKLIRPTDSVRTFWRATWVIALIGALPALLGVYEMVDKLSLPSEDRWSPLGLSWCYVLALWLTTLCTDRGFGSWQWAMPYSLTPSHPWPRWRAAALGLAMLSAIEAFRLAWLGPQLFYGGAIAAGLLALLAWGLQLVSRAPRPIDAAWPQLAISDLLIAIALFAILMTVYNARLAVSA